MNSGNITIDYFLKQLLDFYNSGTFSVIKFIIGIYVIVLFVDLILLLFQRGVGEDIRITMLGSDIPKELMFEKSRLKNEWKKLRKNLESGEENKYKLAIIKADAIIENMLDRLKYKGKDFSEKVANVPAGQVEHLDDIKRAHETRNKIIHNENFPVDKRLAEETIALYEKFLEFFGVFH